MSAALYAFVYAGAVFAGIFLLAFVCFGVSETMIPNRPVDFAQLAIDTLCFTTKIWCAAMIVSAIGALVKKSARRK